MAEEVGRTPACVPLAEMVMIAVTPEQHTGILVLWAESLCATESSFFICVYACICLGKVEDDDDDDEREDDDADH